MPSLHVARASNAAWKPSYRPVAVFLGGTSGIGEAMVKALARHTNGNAHIVVVGRNEAAANSIIASLPKHENSQYEFVSCDATLVRNVKTVTADLITRLPKLNFLVETSGYLTLRGREETDEGIDRKMALNFYSRWQFADDLLPPLKKAKEEGEDAKVMTILAAGRNGSINLDDLALKKNYSLAIAGAAVPSYNDLMVEEYAARNKSLAFIHAFPGVVRTNMVTNFRGPIRYIAPVINALSYPLAVSAADCAEWMLYPLLSKDCAEGGFLRDNHGDDVGKSKFSTPEAREKIWAHLHETINV